MSTFQEFIVTIKTDYNLTFNKSFQCKLEALYSHRITSIMEGENSSPSTSMDNEDEKLNITATTVDAIEDCKSSRGGQIEETIYNQRQFKQVHAYKMIQKQKLLRAARNKTVRKEIKQKLDTIHLKKCRFFPFCQKGLKCRFYHPTEQCAYLPRCRYGKKCLYIHQVCRYDGQCTRIDCSYSHKQRKTISDLSKAISYEVTQILTDFCHF